MMRKRVALFFWVLLFMVFTTTCWAVPEYINYQGRLVDSEGSPLDGVFLVEFLLYDVVTGGTSIWDEQQDVTVAGSIFNVKIGSDDSAGNPLLPEYFDSNDLYLEIKIFNTGPGWETLEPRQQLTSTPYAMKAAVADSVVDNSVVTDMLTNDAVTQNKISSDAVGGDELAANAVTASEIADNAVGTGEIEDNAVTAAKISPHIVSSVDGVSNDGGNIDLVPGSNISITPDNANNRITIGATTPIEYLTESEGDTRYVNSAGDTISGVLTVSGSLYADALNALYVGTDNNSDDDYIRMDSGTEFLMWDETPGRFNFSDDLFISGRLSIGGNVDTQDVYNRIGSGTPSSSDMANSGDLYVTYDIEAGSEVYARDYKYTISKTYVLNIPAVEFIKSEFYQDTVWRFSGSYSYTSSPGTSDLCIADVGVHLPDGAVVTSIEMQYYDNLSSRYVRTDLKLYRRRYDSVPYSTMASIPTFNSGTNANVQTRTQSTVSDPVINNDYYYVMSLFWNPEGTTLSGSLRFYGARISYTLDEISH